MPELRITREQAVERARRVHYGDADRSYHRGDEYLDTLLYASLTGANRAARYLRAADRKARDIWSASDEVEDLLASQVQTVTEGDVEDSATRELLRGAGIEVQDQYTAERVRNQKTETLTRYMIAQIMPNTPIVNNLFRRLPGDPTGSPSRLAEDVVTYETISDFELFPIDPDRGELRPIEVNRTLVGKRITHVDRMYGAMLEYERFLQRVLPNTSLGEIFSMLSVGWAKASARKREKEASHFATNVLDPVTLFDNGGSPTSTPLGQLTGLGVKGYPNGTFNFDYDFPRMLDYMISELQMDTSNLIMMLPRNAWSFLATKQGWKQFLGLDGNSLYQRPQISQPSAPTGFPDDEYGIRFKGVGPRSAGQAAGYLTGTRPSNGGLAAEFMIPGNYHLLPEGLPNWGAEFVLPSSAFGPMRVVLTPYQQAKHRYYPAGHPMRDDDITEQPRPIMVTDLMLFDGNRPLNMIDTIPPTSWDAYEELHRRGIVAMVEGWSFSTSARGQQAVRIKNAVLDHDYRPDIVLDGTTVKVTNSPVGGGLASE